MVVGSRPRNDPDGQSPTIAISVPVAMVEVEAVPMGMAGLLVAMGMRVLPLRVRVVGVAVMPIVVDVRMAVLFGPMLVLVLVSLR